MEAATQPLVPTKHALLRPDQVSEMLEEKASLESKMHNPRVEDKGPVREQLRRLSHQFETQRPKPFAADEIDRAVKREAELKEKILDGMLSQEEMRRCPPGAADHHRAWEDKNRDNIQEWQNIKRRMDCESGNQESASIETFRPRTSHMNMDNSIVPGKQFFLPPPGSAPTVTFSSAEIAKLRELAPDMAPRLPVLSNEQRAELKAVLREFMDAAELERQAAA